MNKDVLSQQEIDALLRAGGSKPSSGGAQQELTEFESDAIGEIGNICFGTAATTLSTLLRHKVEISTPKVDVVPKINLQNDFPIPHVAVRVEYTQGFRGANVLAIHAKDAGVIADLMLGGDGRSELPEFNEMHLSAVSEAMNQMMGSAATSMSTIFNMMVNISPPAAGIVDEDMLAAEDLFPESDTIVKVSFRLVVGDLIDSHIMEMVPIEFAKEMVALLVGQPSAGEPSKSAAPNNNILTPQRSQAADPGSPAAGTKSSSQAPAPVSAPLTASVSKPASPGPQPSLNVQPVKFTNLKPAEPADSSPSNLDLLLDIPLSVTVELGRSRKQIRDILALGHGSIIELDKLAGEPVDILVNNKLVAKGEVVVIEENFGVRVTDIISPVERMRKLQ